MEKVDLTFPGSMAETVAYRRNGWIRILSPIGTLSFPEESANSWAGDIEQAMQSPLYRIGLLAEAKARSTIQGILARKRHRKTVLRNYLNKVNSKA